LPTPQALFYVKNLNNELVPSKFLQLPSTGAFVQDVNYIDVNPVNTRNGHYYDATGTELLNFNPHNFLVVPINFDFQAALDFGKSLQGTSWAIVDYEMTNAFVSRLGFAGTYNLQKTYQTDSGANVSGESVPPVPMYQDATSYVLGAVAAQNGNVENAIIGGGILNWSWWGGKDTSGPYYNNPRNVDSIKAGAALAGSYAPPVPASGSPWTPSTTPTEYIDTYTAVIRYGDTLSKIQAEQNAKGNWITASDLMQVNGLAPGDELKLLVGQKIVVPEKVNGNLVIDYGDVRVSMNPKDGSYQYLINNRETGTGILITHTVDSVQGTVTDRYVEADSASGLERRVVETLTNSQTGEILGSSQIGITAPSSPTADSLAALLNRIGEDLSRDDATVVDVSEVRTIAGAQGANEVWGGGKLLEVSDGSLANWYKTTRAAITENYSSISTGAPTWSDLLEPLPNGSGNALGDIQTAYSYSGLGLVPNWNLSNTTSVVSFGASGSSNNLGLATFDQNQNFWNQSFTLSVPTSEKGFICPAPGPDGSTIDGGNYWADTAPYVPEQTFQPIALDLDGDGVELIGKEDSRAYFDVKGDGFRHNIGWVSGHDAMLAIDNNGDGKIDQATELSFALRTASTTDTDLEALGTEFDTNHDGKVDASDARFADLRVWQDKNGDGVTDAGELSTLTQSGITSIDLSIAKTDWVSGGNRVQGFSSYTKTDGTKGWTADVGLGFDAEGWKATAESGFVRVSQSGGLSYALSETSPLNVNLGLSALDGVIGGTGNDVLSAGAKIGAMLEGGAGNDVLVGGAGDDWLVGGTGSDTLSGGDGDDTLVIDAQDAVANINGGNGFDVVVVEGSVGVSIDLGKQNLESVLGSEGADHFGTSGTGRVIVAGRGGDDSLGGSANADIISGGTGNDTLLGAGGDDVYVFDSGDGSDQIDDSAVGQTLKPRDVYHVDFDQYGDPDLAFSTDIDERLAYHRSQYFLLSTFGWRNPSTGKYQPVTMLQHVGNYTSYYTRESSVVTTAVDAGQDTLMLGQNIAVSDVEAEMSGSDLVVGIHSETQRGGNVSALSDRVTIKNQSNAFNSVETIKFSDGTTESIANWRIGTAGGDSLVGDANANRLFGGAGNDTLDGGAGNDTLNGGIGNDTYLFGRGSGQDTIAEWDSTAGNLDTLQFTAGVAVGDVSVSRTAIDLILTINGTTDKVVLKDWFTSDAAKIEQVRFSDGTVWSQADLAAKSNVPVTAGAAIGALTTAEDAPFSYQIPAAAFIDPDAGEVLHYRMTRADGSALPGWLTFDEATRTLSGIPSNSDVGTLALQVVATDHGGASAVQTFSVAVSNVNDAPTVVTPIEDQSAHEGAPFAFQVPAGALVDIDAGDVLIFNASKVDGSPLPSWLQFDASSRSFTGTPAAGDIGIVNVKVTATDQSGQSASDTFVLAIGAASMTGTAGADFLVGTPQGDVLLGLEGNDSLMGMAGNDLLDGGAGIDSMAGGNGNDTYIVDTPTDTVTENLNEGIDTVQSSIRWTLGDNVENLVLTGTAAIDGTGNSLNNTLTGNNARNTLDGGLGADTMIGGQGDDGYMVDDVGDVVVESASEGVDTVYARVDYTLGANIENLVLFAAATTGTGNDLDNALYGSDVNNVLYGGAGNDRLNGGLGDDTLVGGQGNDSYVVDSAGDTVVEAANEGIDEVVSTVTYSIANCANVENLTLTGFGAISGTGNSLANTIYGNNANNNLDGGLGADIMAGGQGDDTYLVDDIGDVVFENANEGRDTVFSRIDYTLGANVEQLVLLSGGAANGTGNELDNRLIGNASNNVLVGGAGNDRLEGKAGVDTLIGGVGNDIYIFEDAADTIVENADEGFDTIISYVSLDLNNYANVENAQLTWVDNMSLVGNALDNHLSGNSGDNLLAGGDGNDVLAGYAGNDTLDGGAGDDLLYGNEGGSDTYIFGRGYGQDTIIDFDFDLTTRDKVQLLPDVATTDVVVYREGSDLILAIQGTSDTLRMRDWYVAPECRIEEVVFADGTVWDLATYPGTIYEGTPIIGTSQNDVLVGTSANETLDGLAGADTMIGGKGDDTYLVQDPLDMVVEGLGEGTDTIKSSVSYVLSENVENLILTGAAPSNATGNALGNALTGNDGNNVLDGGAGADTMVGGLGDDTYYVDDALDVVTENAGEGVDQVMSSLAFYQLGANIENGAVVGSLSYSTLWGNTLNNTLVGNEFSNDLNGAAGADTMIGGLGNDTYLVDNVGDVVVENAGEGLDSVSSYIDYSLVGSNVERLYLMNGSAARIGTGNELDNTIDGNGQNNILYGGAGKDRLRGRGGADTLVGGAGNDTYVLEDANDTIIEAANEGIDTIVSSFNIDLTTLVNIENAQLSSTGNGSIVGNALDNYLSGGYLGNVSISGGAGNDVISGGSGNDLLDGGDGNDVLNAFGGNDTLDGGAGDDTLNSNEGGSDTYIFGRGYGQDTISDMDLDSTTKDKVQLRTGIATSDVVISREGSDLLLAIAGTADQLRMRNWYVAPEYRIEELLFSDGTVWDLNSYLAAPIVGTAGNDVLVGSVGADTMIGGLGDDTYYVDDALDVVTENAGEGIDQVMSSIAFYQLGANVENGTIIGALDYSALSGNELDNTLIGNEFANDFSGGDGADTMIGGLGDDSYSVTDIGDVIVENPGEGDDYVYSYIDYSLVGSSLERLYLMNGGTACIATGNELDNLIYGNRADNTIYGGAGDDRLRGKGGADTLVGGAGNDTYVVEDAYDTIIEAPNEGIDTIISSTSVDLTTLANIENVELTSTGDSFIIGSAADNELRGTYDGNNSISGGAGNDTISGGIGNDLLDGGTGNDNLYGLEGSDTYVFGRGYGADIVIENDATTGNTDIASFLSGIGADQIWFRHVGNDLEASIIGTSDTLTIQNWYSGSAYHVEQFKTADGKTLTDSQVESLVQAMASFAPPGSGQTTLPTDYQTALQPVIAANWQ
jgi:Ca2+-binding RTX toxin-like protein